MRLISLWWAWLATLKVANGTGPFWRGPLFWAVASMAAALVLDQVGSPWGALAVVGLFFGGLLWLAVLFRLAQKGPDSLAYFVGGAFALAVVLRILYDVYRIVRL